MNNVLGLLVFVVTAALTRDLIIAAYFGFIVWGIAGIVARWWRGWTAPTPMEHDVRYIADEIRVTRGRPKLGPPQ